MTDLSKFIVCKNSSRQHFFPSTVFIFLCLSFFALPTYAQENTLILTLSNGDRVSGKVETVSAEQIELANVYAPRFPVKITAIKSWKCTDGELRQKLSAVISIKDEDAAARAAQEKKTSDQMLAVNSVATTTPAPAEKKQKADPWKRQVNFAYTMTRGNVRSSDVNLAFNIARKRGTRKVAFTSFGRSGVNDGKQSANLFTSTLRYERTALHLPVFAESQFEVDKLKKLDYRFSENLGMSLPVLKKEDNQLSFDFGTGFTREEYETGLKKTNATSLLRLKASQKLVNKSLLQQQATIFSDLTDPSAYRFQAEASLTTPLTKYLALRVAGINRYDARPQGQVKPNDFTLLTGFTFDF